MPTAFKEWAVTVRALAEGEQLVTLRKGGIREDNKHFELDHDRFFLYPTFEHQRNDVVRASHQPELRRALEDLLSEHLHNGGTYGQLDMGIAVDLPLVQSGRLRALG